MLGRLKNERLLNDPIKLHERKNISHVFCAFVKNGNEFLIGKEYQKFYSIDYSGVIEKTRQHADVKILRNLSVIKRDWGLLQENNLYCFNTQDAQNFDYKKEFNLEKHPAVFQYHRWADQPALILPLPGYHSFPSWNIPKFESTAPFRSRASKIIWRGGPSGSAIANGHTIGFHNILTNPHISVEQKHHLLLQIPRYNLPLLSKDIDFMDFGIVLSKPTSENDSESIISSLTKSRQTPIEQSMCRYILSLDGYDGPSNMYWAFNSGSLVFRQTSNWRLFGDNYFIPWIHFVPIEATISDIQAKFEWAERNVDKCAEMVENARSAWRCLFDWPLYKERIKKLYLSLRFE